MVWVPMRQLSIQVTVIKVNRYMSWYVLQHGTLVQNEQQAIKGPKLESNCCKDIWKWYSFFAKIYTKVWSNSNELRILVLAYRFILIGTIYQWWKEVSHVFKT